MTINETRPGPVCVGAGLGDEMPGGRIVMSRLPLSVLVEQASVLASLIADQAEEVARAWREGYMAGFATGVETGEARERAAHERAAGVAWKAVREVAPSGPSHAELEAIRYPGYTPERLRELREAARERLRLPDRTNGCRSSAPGSDERMQIIGGDE